MKKGNLEKGNTHAMRGKKIFVIEEGGKTSDPPYSFKLPYLESVEITRYYYEEYYAINLNLLGT